MKKAVSKGIKDIFVKGLVLGLSFYLGLAGQWEMAKAATNEVYSLSHPNGLYSTEDALYVLDGGNNVVYTLKNGKMEAVYGKSGAKNIYGEADGDYLDGNYQTSYFQEPYAMAPYKKGFAISDTYNNVIRFVADGKTTTIAGSKKAGLKDAKGTKARFNNPKGLAADEKGNLYIADCLNNVIRKMDTKGKVTTYAGVKKGGYKDGKADKALFYEPAGLYWYKDALYVADSGNHCIRRIKDGKVETVAGGKNLAYKNSKEKMGDYKDGAAKKALFDRPEAVLVRNGVIYVADSGNSAVRKIEKNKVSTIVKLKDDAFYPVKPKGLAFWNGKLYVGDNFSGMVYALKKTEWKGKK